MTQTFTLVLSPNTVLGRDFVAELPGPTKPLIGTFVVKQTFVDFGAINTAAGEMVDDPVARPVLRAGEF
jgi:hypothetical protein